MQEFEVDGRWADPELPASYNDAPTQTSSSVGVDLHQDRFDAGWRRAGGSLRATAFSMGPLIEDRHTGWLVLDDRGPADATRLTDRGLRKRMVFHTVPTLSLVPDALAPPKGCWPTTAPVGWELIT